MSDSRAKEPQHVLCHCCVVVLLVEINHLFVQVDQLLVLQPIGQFEILRTSLEIALFCEPILSCADVVQHTLHCVAAKRIPRAMIEDSSVNVIRPTAHVASLLMLPPTPYFSLIFETLTCFLPEKLVQSVFATVAHLLLVRAVELASAHNNCAPHDVLSKHSQNFASQPLRTDEWQREIVFVVESKHVKLFRANHSELLVPVVSPNEQFLEAQELLVNPEGVYWDTISAKGVDSGLMFDRLEAVNIVERRSQPVRTLPMPKCSTEHFSLAGICGGMSDMRESCVVVVVCQVHFWNKSSGRIKITVGLQTCMKPAE